MFRLPAYIYGAIVGILIGLALIAAPAHSAPLTAKQAGDALSSSVVEFLRDSNRICTAFKVGDRQFTTAKHCASLANSEYKVSFNNHMSFARSILLSVVDKEDWAVVSMTTTNDKISSLPLGCNEELYLGMPVAYAGYPAPLKFTMGLGSVVSVLPVKSIRSKADFMIDVAAAPGASGSPIISLDTGNVVGILTELIRNPKSGFFIVGIESIKSTYMCDGTDADQKKAPFDATPF